MAHLQLDVSSLHAILGHTPAFIYVMDLDFYVLYMNRFQPPYTAEDTIGAHIDKFFTPEVAAYSHRFYRKVIETGEDQNLDYFIDYPDGVRRWYYTRIAAMRDDAGTMTGIICNTTEVTAQKQAEQQIKLMQAELVAASRRAGMAEVITGVLHNIGNVLNSITVSATVAMESAASGHVDLLMRTIKLIQEHERDLGTFFTSDPRGRKLPSLLSQIGAQLFSGQAAARAELKRLMDQVGIIRSTIEAQQSMAKPREVLEEGSPGEIVERAVSMFRIDFDLEGIELEVTTESSARILIDRQATLQILVNLIRNAIEALIDIEGPRRLEVKTHTSDESVHFDVIDNGCGIPEENCVKIFHYGFTTKERGHGFGLHTSAVSAQSMGGSLQVESEGPGRGAKFCLILPRHAVPPPDEHGSW
jgi:PAS domain S-box-containing protein